MDKAYQEYTWHDRPSTLSPLDEINLNAVSRGLSLVDDRVISVYNTLQDSVANITVDETTGLLTIRENGGRSYTFNALTRVYNTISANQQAVQSSFSQVSQNFSDVHDLLDSMNDKIDLNADSANAGITNLQTTITQNDGYYRQEMSGIQSNVDTLATNTGSNIDALYNTITSFKSSITQTTNAIQLSVDQINESVGDLSDDLDSQVSYLSSRITQTAGEISLKVTRGQIINGLQTEFAGSAIQITPDRITFASTGAMVVNTTNFKLDVNGNAEFTGTVYMEAGYVGGYPIVTYGGDDPAMAVQHSTHAWKLRSAWSASEALTDRDEFTTDGTSGSYALPQYDANPDYVFVALWKITGASTYDVVDPSLYFLDEDRANQSSRITFVDIPPAGETYQLCYKVRFYVMLTKKGNLVGTTNETAGHDGDANDATERIDIGYQVHPFRAGYFHKVVPGNQNGASQVGLSNRPFHEGYFENLYVNGEPVGPGGGGAGSACVKKEATLLAANWSNNSQTITLTGVDADETKQCIQIASKSANMSAFLDAGILVTAQAANSLTFKCQTTPATDLDIYVVIFTILTDAANTAF